MESARPLFQPSFTAIVPQVVPQEDLLRANALKELVEPLGIRFVGPAIGGITIEALGVGAAFALDAGDVRRVAGGAAADRAEARAPGRDAGHIRARRTSPRRWRYVRAHAWLWVTLASASLALLASYGPLEVLLPYVIKNDLEEDAATFGFVLGRGRPRRDPGRRG